jgi:hypothetical protein
MSLISVSLPEENQGNRPYVQGQWNGSHWLLDGGKLMEYTAWTAGTNVKDFDSGDCIKLYPELMRITVSKCTKLRPVICAYDLML